jgi:SAM-dependent methyltransferase
MELAEQRAWWDGAAKANAASAVLSNKSSWDADEFYASGDAWLDEVRAFAGAHDVQLTGKRALDFGCGLGRMSAALGKHFSVVVGLDISSEMVGRAQDALLDRENLVFSILDSYPFPFASKTFDLVFSTIVIQHISEPHNLRYIAEFFRVTAPGGYTLFDAPVAVTPEQDPGAGIFICPEDGIMHVAQENGMRLIATRDFPATSTRHLQYIFRKPL